MSCEASQTHYGHKWIGLSVDAITGEEEREGGSLGGRPRGCVTPGVSVDEVLEIVVLSAGVSKLACDADGERVAADTGEVFGEQASCSFGIAGGGCADHLDVVALPVRLLASGSVVRRSGDGAEVGDGQPEGRVGVDREAQRLRRLACIDGSLRLAVERGRPRVCGYRTAVVLDRRSGIGQAIVVAAGLAGCRLHDCQVARVA